jgi:phosphate:Na+ symporter
MIGVAVFCGAFYGIDAVVDFAFLNTDVSPLTIAIFHTVFNIISTIILMPFCSLLEKLAVKTIKGKKEEEDNVFAVLDDRFLDMPGFAVEKCREVVADMAKITKKALVDATYLLDGFDKEVFKSVSEAESRVDKYEDKASSYLVKLSGKQLSKHEGHMVTELLHCIGDIERIADHAVNIAEVAQELYDKKSNFSENAAKEVGVISEAIREVITLAIDAFVEGDFETAKKVEPLEQVIDDLNFRIKNRHIQRLRAGECTIELGFVLNDILTNYERVSDHCSNVAVSIIQTEDYDVEAHQYIGHLKDEDDFKRAIELVQREYRLPESAATK